MQLGRPLLECLGVVTDDAGLAPKVLQQIIAACARGA